MTKIKVLNVFSLIFNMAIVAGVLYSMIATLNMNFISSLKFFTILSNLLVGIAALINIPFNLRGMFKGRLLPKAIISLKLVATVSVTITLLVVVALLTPLNGGNIAAQFGNFSFNDIQFFQHLLVPVVAIIAFLFFDQGAKTKWKVNFLSIIPVFLYGIFYIINYFAHIFDAYVSGEVTYDWYGLVDIGGPAVGALLFVAIVVVGFFVSLLLWWINRSLGKAYFPVTDDADDHKYVESVKPEKPVEEEKPELAAAPASSEKPKEEPVKEEAPVEEEPEKAEEKPAVKVYRVVEPKKAPAKKKEEVAPAKEEPAKEEPAPAPAKEEPVKQAPAKKAAPAKKKEEKPAPSKKQAAPAKKEEAPAQAKKQAAPAKKEEKPAPSKKPAPAKKKEEPAPAKEAAPAKDNGPTKVYHLTKRKEDGMWAITFVGGQKAVKLFKTKKEAEAALEVLTKNQGATALIRNSKGAKAGKFASSIKTDDKDKK